MTNADDVLERLEQVEQGLGRGWREDLIRDLAAALRAARKDSERLDWLDKTRFERASNLLMDAWYRVDEACKFREVIDAAMGETRE